MLDNRIIRVSITRKPQIVIFQKPDPIILINIFISKNHKIRIRKKKVISIGIIQVSTLLDNIMFHVFLTNILFLYYFQDIDYIKVKLENI
jgi:hypothetical protein